MTKKDYIAIAEIFSQYKPIGEKTKEIIWDLCLLFKKDNSRFNEEKFKKACGL